MTSGLRAGELSPTLGLVEMTDMKKDVRASLQNLDASNSCQIVFRNLTYTISKTVVEDKKKVVKERDILKNISGYFRPGRFTAIMGASGAGKTSFLNVIGKYILML
ncbi:hypothetical protein BC829DRAFT_51966 [Chytridium lagenaria]|nr:hypothetical protein BC829DRAFT_51966 [Chytridium lagenaria]